MLVKLIRLSEGVILTVLAVPYKNEWHMPLVHGYQFFIIAFCLFLNNYFSGIIKVSMNHKKLGITKDIAATKVLPFLFPLSIDNNLNLHQVRAWKG